MKKIFLTALGVIGIYLASAQDVIILRSNTSIKSRVIEVGTSEIKYKRFENPDGPVYVIRKDEVQMIKYENGSSDVFTIEKEKTSEKPAAAKAPASPYREKASGTIYAALSAPLGSFADSKEGGAQLGWGFGVTGASAFTGRNAYFSYQISYANHPYEFNGNSNGFNYSLAGDYNVWHFLVGAGTRSQPSSSMFYMNVMGGLNYTALTGALAQAGYSDAMTFAISIGTGIIFSQSINIGLKYLYSNPTFKNNNSSSYNVEQKISVFQVIAGFRF